MTRRGVTFIEVLFAIGLILVGMVGLISVIPVASHQARDTVSLNAGAAMATKAFGELKAREYLKPNNWAVISDAAATPSPPAAFPVQAWEMGLLGICIDPLFMAEQQNYVSEAAGGYYVRYTPTGSNGYQRFRFPYYKGNHNPLVDPSVQTTSSNHWPGQPRMFRVSVDRASQLGIQMISNAEAMLVSQGSDDVALHLTDDRSLDSVLLDSNTQVSLDGNFSWMATATPLPGGTFASVSTIIFRNRDRSFHTPRNSDGPAAQARDNAAGERLAWVTTSAGFQGGAGGTLTIASAVNTPSNLSVNDWLMLSQTSPTFGPPVHRWYRVTSTINDPLITTVTDPFRRSHEVWTRQIMVDGPDWNFDADAPPTFATLVDDIVAVTTHTVPLSK